MCVDRTEVRKDFSLYRKGKEMKNIIQRLREKRKGQKLTQESLAKKLGVSKDLIRSIEEGRRPCVNARVRAWLNEPSFKRWGD
jgi:ribosome-binding protein aMBF1 (putative translation factor)